MSEKRVLQVVDGETGQVVHSVDVSGRSDRAVEKIERGMLRNMDDRFFVREKRIAATRLALQGADHV